MSPSRAGYGNLLIIHKELDMTELNINFYSVSKLDPRYSKPLCDITGKRTKKSVDFVLDLIGIKDADITVDVQKDWFENLINKLKTMKSQMMPGMEHYNVVEYLLGRLNFIADDIDWNLDDVKMYVGYWD